MAFLYGATFGVWFGVSCYRLFELFRIDAENLEAGYNEAEEYGVSQAGYFFFSLVSAFGWPILMPLAYFMPSGEDDDG
jgi:hypothetical protein